jgi:hypothetical protein
MSLLNSELDRIRAELGYNVLNVGAEPYIGVQAIFSNVVQTYMREGAGTTSATAVTASTTGTPKLVTITLASATGVSLLDKIAVDVDEQLEMTTVRGISGAAITCYLTKEHAGTYPIAVDGGLVAIRECLAALSTIRAKVADLDGTGTLKKVDEIEWYDVRGRTQLAVLAEQANYWRGQLSSLCGVANRNSPRGQGSVFS